MSKAHTFPIRVYYEDTDAGGVVYHSNFIKFAERARTEALRQGGINQCDLLENEKIAFAVRSCNVEFLKPARLDDLLTIESRLDDIGNASLSISQTIRRQDEILVTLAVKLVVVNTGMKPTRIPDNVREVMARIFNT